MKKLPLFVALIVFSITFTHAQFGWGVKGGLAFPLSVMALIYPVDKAYGEKLEVGLKDLKAFMETKFERGPLKTFPAEE